MENLKPAPEPKTPGTLAVEKHRPLLNKLTAAQRRRLRQRAAALLYGHEAPAPGCRHQRPVDLAEGVEAVLDSFALLDQRLPGNDMLVVPSVLSDPGAQPV